MEAAAAPQGLYAGASTAADMSNTHEDDARHFAITASQVPKPTGMSNSLPPMPLPGPLLAEKTASEIATKESKNSATQTHEDGPLGSSHAGSRLHSDSACKGEATDAERPEGKTKKPLGLLDLPVDILKDVVREVTHTNDLTSLALCHSALHALAISHIYSRFDIVWPDNSAQAEPRSGVDALTYGLATLVMAEDVFGEAPHQRRPAGQGNRFAPGGKGKASELAVRRRRGNHYAQYTKKFSLGNGPADWVSEYQVHKEGGKMLGTLVALAVARMRTLETFIWDMPTGILRDVWLALSSLADRDDGMPCRLEKVWVRWHANGVPDPHNPSLAYAALAPLRTQLRPSDLDRVEHPSFSVLPPLASLSVLDIDELAYLDEMAVLIGRSRDKLRELRVGIARHAMARDWYTIWQGNDLQQIDYDNPTAGSLTIGEKRLGGVLGTLMGMVRDMREPKTTLPHRTRRALSRPEARISVPPVSGEVTSQVGESDNVPRPQGTMDEAQSMPLPTLDSEPSIQNPTSENAHLATSNRTASPPIEGPNTHIWSTAVPHHRHSSRGSDISTTGKDQASSPPTLNHCLQLECLELERVPLSIQVLQQCLDWSRLTSLTILHCQNHEALWKTLRRAYPPTPRSPHSSVSSPRKSSRSTSLSNMELVYPLKLKRLHTNTVSPALVSFLKDTLAPNTLEQLFLQEARSYTSSVSVEAIFRGPLRRHRLSLKKLLIDSSERGTDGIPTGSSRWRRWILSKEVLAFVVGGKMPALRELGAAVDYKDWHFFLQHLPEVPHIRSLYIPFLADHPHGPDLEPRDLAQQVMLVVALRPEIELCYLGIANKCYEILEVKPGDASTRTESLLAGFGSAAGTTTLDDHVGASDPEGEEEADEEDLLEEEDEMDDDEDDGDDDEGNDHGGEEDDDVLTGSETSEEDDNEDDSDGTDSGSVASCTAGRVRLREILFYDDKVSIFRVRHGKL